MRLEQMSGHRLPELAVWPQPCYERNSWAMYSLRLREDNSLHWYRRFIEREGRAGLIFSDVYDSYTSATDAALKLNEELKENLETLLLMGIEKVSLRLKVEKALTAKTRLTNEEQLMFEVAIKNHAHDPRVLSESLIVEPDLESLRSALFEVLCEMPYLRFVYLPLYRTYLTLLDDNIWMVGREAAAKASKYFYQERIARGFGLSGAEHWGKTKSAIRGMLLPRANQLLQLSSVKRMLAEARMKGKKVLLVDGFVFWFEEHNQLGWVVKEANDSGAHSKGNTLWKEGTILSKNHGRIVVLPYIKENGEQVQGHTKNAPHDGKALPRHQDEYVELPFDVLEGDVMRGLFGELHYE